MSPNLSTENPISPLDWLEKSIQEENIKLFKYDEFHSIQSIGQGGFGEVFSAKLRRGGNDVQSALKCLKQSSNSDIFEMKEFIKEMQFFRTVGYFPNIIHFFGVTKILSQGTLNKYMLVLEYANGGTLRQYLQSNFSNMDGTEKLRLANEMTSGIACLHAENIIHRDLNSSNVLIHNSSIKISDLGLAKNLKDISGKSSKVFGQIFYVEPQYLLNHKYIRNEKSDIYALGVLLWELSSGRPPCFNIGSIVNGGRETPIQNTPAKYVKLYTECWDNSPQVRPSIFEVLNRLNQIEWISSCLVLGKIDNSFSNYTTISLNGISSISSEAEAGNSNAQYNLGICYEKGLGTTKNFEKAFELYSKAAEAGNSNAQYKLGYCYYKGLGTTKNFEKAFELYSKAAEAGNPNAQNHLGYCYEKGLGTTKNIGKAFELYPKAAEAGKSNAQNNLGWCYEKGLGTTKNFKKAFELYSKAAEAGDLNAQYNLGYCYYRGLGTTKNFEKAFELYSKAAEAGDSNAQYNLGYCYYKGLGTTKNFDKAFELYSKAVEAGNSDAQYHLGRCYQNGLGATKNFEKAFELYTKAAEAGNSDAKYNLGFCYYNGYGTTKNLEKAFELYSKAAEAGSLIAQNSLDGFMKINRKQQKSCNIV
ncbi:hypothetical protein G9A89_006789 [Geosiphon pyriformis]|nr:hypothetical protein G9A89_006789 [Geosiphon pyriformis]